jgi:myo-inositol-1-phosphate synthase
VMDAQLSVIDSPNSAGVVIDAVRYLKVAAEMGVSGALRGPSAFTQKTPPEFLSLHEAQAECDALSRRELSRRQTMQASPAVRARSAAAQAAAQAAAAAAPVVVL